MKSGNNQRNGEEIWRRNSDGAGVTPAKIINSVMAYQQQRKHQNNRIEKESQHGNNVSAWQYLQ
jgi:hypothetical protein